jgi:uncharacterized protein GlcG (DUF336 family)
MKYIATLLMCLSGALYSAESITLEKANAIIHGAITESQKLSLHPMSFAVLDTGGHLIAFARQDGAGILRYDIAFAKAYGALGMGMSSREIYNKSIEIPKFIEGAISASNGRLIPAPGGVLVFNQKHELIGAVGASGDTSEHDEQAVLAGIQSAGLISQN